MLVLVLGCSSFFLSEFPDPLPKSLSDNPSEDWDGDGFSEEDGDVYEDGTSADNDASVYPGATEFCDEKDNNLNGLVDETSEVVDAPAYVRDGDGDGYGLEETLLHLCPVKVLDYPEYILWDGIEDCDDSSEFIYPAAAPSEPHLCTQDLDLDGYGDDFGGMPPENVDAGRDCDDEQFEISPNALEVCGDEQDNDCDGHIDLYAVDAPIWFIDSDLDGFGAENYPNSTCSVPGVGFSSNSDDCDDNDELIFPGSAERCNDVDDDCDGDLDEEPSDGIVWYADVDEDGFGQDSVIVVTCSSEPPQGFVALAGDCNDNTALRYPGASELCNDADDDCDGVVDESAVDAEEWFFDFDQDGYGSELSSQMSCVQPEGYLPVGGDCNDYSADVSPAQDEYCDGFDNNCDAMVDDSSAVDPLVFYEDADSDGYGYGGSLNYACASLEGYVEVLGDCDDLDPDINPQAEELCDGVDNDCSGIIDEDDAVDAQLWYLDQDEDGYGTDALSQLSCYQIDGHVSSSDDCNDSDSQISPQAEELCDGIDNDCDELVDESSILDSITPATDSTSWYHDSDNDGFGDESSDAFLSCDGLDLGEGYFAGNALDCDDQNEFINPLAVEDCDDSTDMDCDGHSTLGAVVLPRWYVDSDEDGYGDPDIYFESCVAPYRYVDQGTDCDDDDDAVYPEAAELCNGKLDDCASAEQLEGADGILVPYNEWDSDGDGQVECELIFDPMLWEGEQTIEGGLDCVDSDPDIYLGAPELCNGRYEDCEGLLAFGEDAIPALEADDDADGFVECLNPSDWVNGSPPELGGADCRDDDQYTFPGAAYISHPDSCTRDAIGGGNDGDQPDGLSDCLWTNCDYSLAWSSDMGLDFRLIESGSFIMGSPEDEVGRADPEESSPEFLEPQHSVTLTRSFYMMTHEFTQAMFEELIWPYFEEQTGDVYDESGFYCEQPYYFGADSKRDMQAESITWHWAAAAANALSDYEYRERCYVCSYDLTVEERLDPNLYVCEEDETDDDMSCYQNPDLASIYECSGYRLPTEAEWEYAARSGSEEAFWTVNGGGNLPVDTETDCDPTLQLTDGTLLVELGLYCSNTITTIAEYQSNDWGLFDMYGGVSEWTNDLAGAYPEEAVTDPTGFSTGDIRIVRGGRFKSKPYELRSAARNNVGDNASSNGLGFRLVRSAE